MRYRNSTYLDLIKPTLFEQIEFANINRILSVSIRVNEQIDDKEMSRAAKLIKDTKLSIMDLELDFDLSNFANLEVLSNFFHFQEKNIEEINPYQIIIPTPFLVNVDDEIKFKKLILQIHSQTKKNVLLLPRNKMKTNQILTFMINNKLYEKIGLVFDPNYILRIGEPITTSYRLCKKYIQNVRVNSITVEYDPVLLGQGDTEYISIFKKLVRDNYQGNITLDSKIYDHLDKINQVDNMTKKFFKFLTDMNKRNKTNDTKYVQIKNLFPNKTITALDLLFYQLKKLNQIFPS